MEQKNHVDFILAILENKPGLSYSEEKIRNEYLKENHYPASLLVRVLSILGGLMATLSFLGFLLSLGIYDSKEALLILGVTLMSLAVIVNRYYHHIVLDTSSISFYVVGFIMTGFSLFKFLIPENLVSLIFILISALTLGTSRSFMLSFIAVLIISGSLFSFLFINMAERFFPFCLAFWGIITTWMFLNEHQIMASHKKMASLYDPLRIGLLVSMLFGLGFLGIKDLISIDPVYIWTSSVLIIGLVLYILYYLLNLLKVQSITFKIGAIVYGILLMAPLGFSPSIAGSLSMVLLCFLVNYKTGLGLSLIAFLYFVFQFYYDLSFTLLEKSGMLFTSGLLFLLAYFFIQKTIVK
jgi:hypothetical protein